VKGNEHTYMLAVKAVILVGSAMDNADILHALLEAGRVEHSWDGDSMSMARLKDGHIKLDSARHKCFAGSNRLTVNQRRTGIVSCYTLLNILERRTEYVWVCLACNNDDFSSNS
jgi:hypothetical protein